MEKNKKPWLTPTQDKVLSTAIVGVVSFVNPILGAAYLSSWAYGKIKNRKKK